MFDLSDLDWENLQTQRRILLVVKCTRLLHRILGGTINNQERLKMNPLKKKKKKRRAHTGHWAAAGFKKNR